MTNIWALTEATDKVRQFMENEGGTTPSILGVAIAVDGIIFSCSNNFHYKWYWQNGTVTKYTAPTGSGWRGRK